MGLAIEGQPDAQAVASEIPDGVVALQEIVAVDAGRLTPSLINTVDRVIAVDCLGDGVYLQVSLHLVAVMIQHNVNGAVLLWGDAEDGSMAGGCHLQFQVLVGQTDGIVVGMGDLLVVREPGGALRWRQAQLTCEGSKGE